MKHDIYLAKGEVLSQELLDLPSEKFEPVVRTEKIRDSAFQHKPISYLRDVMKRFVQSRISFAAFIIICIIVIMAILGPALSGYQYLEQNGDKLNLPPRIQGLEKLGIFDGTTTKDIRASNLEKYIERGAYVETIKEFDFVSRGRTSKMLKIRYNAYVYNGTPDDYHWFGTDTVGRDLFARVWMGTRISLILAVAVVAINLTIGLLIGSLAGYYGGWIDFFLQRLMEILNYIPQMPLAILLIIFFGAGMKALMLCFVLTGWISMAASVRVQFYRYKSQEYVLVSRTMGAKDPRIMYKYILPNAIGTLITVSALTIPSVIFQEAGLSYLGLGIQAPEPSVGTLLADGQKVLLEFPHLIVFPGLVIVLLMLSFNLFGNGLRDAFNPTLRQ